MTIPTLLNSIYYNVELPKEEARLAGLIIFLMDVTLLEKKGKNLRGINYWCELFALDYYGTIAKLANYGHPEVSASLIKALETIDDSLPLKVVKKDDTHYIVSVDKEHELYDRFFKNNVFLAMLARVEKNFSDFTV